MKEFWDNRYAETEFAYGKVPNKFFKKELDKLIQGKILLPADGEGRNSVYAAKNNWESYACDISSSGKTKAVLLAERHKTKLTYDIGDFGVLNYKQHSFDAIALIYAHFPPSKKMEYLNLVNDYLKIGGVLIFEGFSKSHLKFNTKNPKVGGPKNLDVLFSLEEVQSVFSNYSVSIAEESIIELSEGDYHIGQGSVVRFVAKKIG